MAKTVFDNGLLKINVRYLSTKNGLFFYYRRIPQEFRAHHGNRTFIRKSLKTREVHLAAKRAAALAAEHDALWASLRSQDGRDLGLTTPENRNAAKALLETLGLAPGDAHRPPDNHMDPHPTEFFVDYLQDRYGDDALGTRGHNWQALLKPVDREAYRLLNEHPKRPRVLLSDALERYLKNHDKGEQPKFAADTRRALAAVFSTVGDFPLDVYKRTHASSVRQSLLSTGNKTGTVRRRLDVINAVFNHGLLEFDLKASVGNPFERLKIAREAQDAETRPPFTTSELEAIAKACRALDDDIRHIVGLQADTGARLGEIVGLRIEDVVLGCETPYVHIRPLERLGRTLKTAQSERKVPLVGLALWGADRAFAAARERGEIDGWLFPRYASDDQIAATHASNTINKWLRRLLGVNKTSHSFRHTMRDRLRHVDAPRDIQDEIGGWGARSVGQGYGEGYRLSQLKGFMDRIVLR